MSSPKTIVHITDISALAKPAIKGIACVQGITTKGKLREPIFVDSWETFKEIFGEYHPESMFPFYCEQALNNGAKLYISRVAHYNAIDDKESYEGLRAQVLIGTDVQAIASQIGIGYNGVKVLVSNGNSASTAHISITAGTLKQEVSEVARDGSNIDSINALLEARYQEKQLVFFARSTNPLITNGTYYLAGGEQLITAITDTDYIGNKESQTGWYAFDNIFDSYYIFNFDRPSPAVDIALANYCAARKDMRFVIRCPLGMTATGMEEYRMGTGIYSHSPIDTYIGKLVTGDIRVSYQGNKIAVSAIAEVCALQMKKQFEWLSTAGPNRGKLSTKVLGSPYNLLSPALLTEYDRLYPKGINAVGIHPTFGAVFWGNRTLLLDETKVLKFDNVADLAMYVRRELLAILAQFNFEPNDFTLFGQIYNAVLPFIETLETARAIYKEQWSWQGDQFATKASELSFNKIEDISIGKYKAKFTFAAIVSNEILEIEAAASDLGTFVEIVGT